MIAPKYEKMFVDFMNCYEDVHVCPWHEMSKDQMETLYYGYITNNDVLDDFQYFYMANYIITRLSGKSDAHTSVDLNNTGFYPLKFKLIDGDVYLVGIKDDEELLLSKLVSINGIDINKIINEITNIVPHGNDGWLRYLIECHLSSIGTMLSLPSIHGSPVVTFNFIDKNGNRVDIEFDTYEIKKIPTKNKKYTRISIPKSYENLYYELNDDTIYFVYNTCINDRCENMSKVLDELEYQLALGHYNKFIIDIRNNTGGNSNNNTPIIDFLKKHDELEIITLTNNVTFSSGRFMYESLRDLGTLVVGEEPGTPINCFGNIYNKEKTENEARIDEGLEPIESNLSHQISSKYFYFDENYQCHQAKTKEEYEAMPNSWKVTDFNPPDVEIIPTLDDYKNDRDVALEYAYNYGKQKTL